MSADGGFGIPGQGAIATTVERNILWGGDNAKGHVVLQSAKYGSGILDDLVTPPSTDIRAGLIVGKVTATGELEEWDHDATDGSEDIWGVVPHQFRTLNFQASAVDRCMSVIVKANFKASMMLIEGLAMVGHANEYLVRRILGANGSLFDDDPSGKLAGGITRFATVSGTTDTLTASQTGTLITYSNAASVTVTLPDPLLGLEYLLVRSGDEEFVVNTTSADDILSSDLPTADKVTYTTASMHLAAEFHCLAVNDAGTVKWLVRTNTTQTSAAGTI